MSTAKEPLEPASCPKYHQIAAELRQKILSGEYRVGQRLPSESSLVSRYGVSRPTAARAYQELVGAGLIERRANAGAFVLERLLPANKRRELGLLIPQWRTTEIFEMICGQLASLARVQDIGLIWSSPPGAATAAAAPDNPQKAELEHAEHLCEEFISRKVSGVFFAPLEYSSAQKATCRRIAERLRQAAIPVVLIDREIEDFPLNSGFDMACMDNIAAGFLMAEHLLKLGCKRIAFVTRPASASTVSGRIAGVREALARERLDTADAGMVLEGDANDTDFVKTRILKKKFEACICANDRTAAQLLQTLLKLGIRVPRDMRVAGFDNAKYATLVAVPLTTIHQPCDEIASLAFDAMMRRLANPLAPAGIFHAVPRLIVRESCGTYLPR
ncbi:MAG: GntR family transcriptional regulator [Opitutaceae bacterium]|jgi:LacI family transcriptional regulator|nr:GntR family transcriptional regulator [Opitutaceae bacterium]